MKFTLFMATFGVSFLFSGAFFCGYYYRDKAVQNYDAVTWWIAAPAVNGTITLRFNHPITWIDLDRQNAEKLSQSLAPK